MKTEKENVRADDASCPQNTSHLRKKMKRSCLKNPGRNISKISSEYK